MNSRFKTKNECRLVFLLTILFLVSLFLFWRMKKDLWTTYDSMAMDYFYRFAVKKGYGPKPSFMPRITYLTINDDTYRYFGKNILDRKDLARINLALSSLDPEAVAYDMIFAMPGPLESDRIFTKSFSSLRSVFLPVGCALSEHPAPFDWQECNDCEQFKSVTLVQPKETGDGQPFYATRILMQDKAFSQAVQGTGDISIRADPDGIYRHIPMVIRIGKAYLPTLSLSMFLSRAGISPGDMIINWGKNITLPIQSRDTPDSRITIPLDQQGLAFVPLVAPMGKDFSEIAVHTFLQAFDDEDLRGNLAELFEGSYVFIADIATGASDLGATALGKTTPLVTMHASFLNALETRTFYSQWDPAKVMLFLSMISVGFSISAIFRSSRVLYGTGFVTIMGLPLITFTEFIHFRMFPVVTAILVIMLLFSTMVILLESAATRARSIIRKVFSRYVPEAVVNQLMANPDNLNLGGEERIATVLFSDIADFTSISERLTPKDLVSLLNHYLTEMTAVILDQGGIIDKFQGDAIMAEFGVPLACPDHADRAVAAGLGMQKRLGELRQKWRQNGLQELYCRVGINTGKMIVGNMGSQRVLDYTVIGDSVNLASRLEGANKPYGTSLMISEFTLGALTPNIYRTRMLDIIRVKGKSEAVKVYEVCGYQHDSIPSIQNDYYVLYEQGYTAYLAQDFILAYRYFEQALDLMPKDMAAGYMLDRVRELSLKKIPLDWDGSIRLTSK